MKRVFKKLALLLVGACGMTAGSPADAAPLTTLKQVQITNGSQVDLLFDGKVSKDQIRVEFFNDIIQVSLTDAAVYPAKISSVNGDTMTKIFAYQYAPRLVRCRISVNGKADDFKDSFTFKPNGKVLTLKLGAASDSVNLSASAPSAAAQAKGNELKISESEERALLEKVLKSEPSPQQQAAEPREKADKAEKSEKAEKKGSKADKSEGKPEGRLTGGKPLPSLWAAFGKLAIVLGIFLVAAFAFRKFKTGELGSKNLMAGAIAKLAKGKLGGGSKVIEVVSTQYLGPKQSIAVVKISGRTLVLGVSGDSINLISQLGSESDLAESDDIDGLTPAVPMAMSPQAPAGAMAAGQPRFSDLLGLEASKPQIASGPAIPPSSAMSSNEVRARIKSRLEGLKPL